jgi:hypothetical protein
VVTVSVGVYDGVSVSIRDSKRVDLAAYVAERLEVLNIKMTKQQMHVIVN